MSRKKIVAGNWKMNTTPSEGLELFNELGRSIASTEAEVIIAAPFLHLPQLVAGNNQRITVAAQNCSQYNSGAYTGEVSVEMLSDIGVNTVIIGHSERRTYFGESHAILKDKVDTVIGKGMRVIFCCGEPLEVRKAENHISYVEKQLKESLFHLSAVQMERVIVAYEPIWAIGTGETASPEQAQDMHHAIRDMIGAQYDKKTADTMSILYGGSVKPTNAAEIFSQADVDGGLVGGASLKVDGFTQIIAAR